MRPESVRIASRGHELGATLAFPGGSGPHPGVLLLPGSGPVNRDENVGRMTFNVTGELSAHLLGAGFATLRFDKRGVGESTGTFLTTGFIDNVNDALAAFDSLREHEAVDPARVFVVGHSEGAVIAARIAECRSTTAGIVLLSGTARSGECVLRWQARELSKNLTGINRWIVRLFRINVGKRQDKQLRKIKASTETVMRLGWFRTLNAAWFREFMAYDPSESLRVSTCPVLALTGDKDIQTDPSHLERMAELCEGRAVVHRLPDVNHILRREPGRPSLANYARQVGEPLDLRVVELVVEWLTEQAKLTPSEAREKGRQGPHERGE